MASIQKTAKGYRAQVKLLGARDSMVWPTRREAVEWAGRRETEIRDKATKPLGEQHTLRSALRKYAEEVSPTKRGRQWEQQRLAAFEKLELPLDTMVGKIAAQHIANFRDARLVGLKPNSVLREMTLLSAVFEVARLEWGWISENPCHSIRKPSAGKHRERVIQWWEIRRLLRQLGHTRSGEATSIDQAIAICMLFALRTGMRAGELRGLQWRHVHDQYVHLPLTKNGKARNVPLSSKAQRLLVRMRGRDAERVFGLNKKCLNDRFRDRRVRAGLSGFTWHDTRHTAATMISKKIDVLDLCKMFGWTDPKMAMVYYNPHASSIAAKLG